MVRLAWFVALALGCGGGTAQGGGPGRPEPGTSAPDTDPEPLPPEMADGGAQEEADPAPIAQPDAGAPVADADAGADAGAPVADGSVADAGAGATADPAAVWSEKVDRGRRRYGRVCYAACHDPGLATGAPNLSGRRLSGRRVRNQVRQGGGDMDPVPVRRLSEADLDAVVAYLSTLQAVRDVQAPAGAAP